YLYFLFHCDHIYSIDDFLFFFNTTATSEIYTLSLHDALPISGAKRAAPARHPLRPKRPAKNASPNASCPRHSAYSHTARPPPKPDRKSTRLNSSHVKISYAVFCLKKKKKV